MFFIIGEIGLLYKVCIFYGVYIVEILKCLVFIIICVNVVFLCEVIVLSKEI